MQAISDALKPLVGRWATTITMLHPEAEAGTTYSAVDTYRWLPGEKVLVHEVEARMGEPVVSIEIYTQDAASGDITSRNVDNHGQVSDYRASMEDGVWKVHGDAERFTSASLTANRIEGLWRLKTDQGWVDWMTVRLDRVG
jgi:hypothetical protein